jgi:hypothetical protein
MFSYARKCCCLGAALILWPHAAWSQWSQAQPVTPGQPPAPVQPAPIGTSGVQLSRDLSQDTQFLALLRARDGQFALVGELRRIIAYHDNFRSRLDRLFLADSATRDSAARVTRETLTASINSGLSRLQKFEADINAASSLSAKLNLAKKFDEDYPLEYDRPTNSNERERLTFVQRERTNADEAFRNVSIENREWLTRYENLFSTVQNGLNQLSIKLPRLTELPPQFYTLAGASSFETLTENQIQLGIDKYRSTLQDTLNEITVLPQSSSVESVRTQVMTQVDTLGRELVSKSSEANTQFRELEKSISNTARSLYGNKVGADSFNYLLYVFAGVFFLVMIVPKFYTDAIATNVLKSEFLLQFSTVFVLIAAIIILGIGELIQKEQLPTLLAGISGYVLGQLGKS